jgi:bifunctional DNase/RNase
MAESWEEVSVAALEEDPDDTQRFRVYLENKARERMALSIARHQGHLLSLHMLELTQQHYSTHRSLLATLDRLSATLVECRLLFDEDEGWRAQLHWKTAALNWSDPWGLADGLILALIHDPPRPVFVAADLFQRYRLSETPGSPESEGIRRYTRQALEALLEKCLAEERFEEAARIQALLREREA